MKIAVLILLACPLVRAQAQPDSADGHLNRGTEFYRNHEYARAIPELRQALQAKPRLPEIHRMLGEALLDQGYAKEALPHLEQGGLLFLHARALLEVNRIAEAIPELLQVMVRAPDDPDVLFYVGKASGELMQQSFGRLMAVHPESVRAREMQAQSLLGQGRADLAEPRFRSLLQAQADLPGIHLALAKILTGRGDLEGAEKELRAEAVRTPGNSEAAWRLGAVLLKKGDSKAAVAELERSDKLKPDMLETLNDLGTAYQLEGQLEAAEKTFERMIAIDDASDLAASAHLHLSQICRKLGKNAEAAVHLKRFRELEPRGGRPEQ